MPHLTITCSANLAGKTDLDALVLAAHRVLMASGLFEPGAPRVRVLLADHYAIADLAPDNAFSALTLQMAEGRPADARRALGDALMTELGRLLEPLFDAGHFALSLEIVETPPAFSWKRNAIHDRLRRG
jgi:5-carboxymethyl-2-hydroxymuconate isomerase